MSSSRVLVVNIGNAVTKIGLYDEDELSASWTVTTPSTITTSEVKTILMNFAFSLPDEKSLNAKGSIISSVKPPITQPWIAALSQECGRKPLVVGPGIKTGMKLGYRDPSELGADRIAEVAGAYDLFGAPLVVVNLETTTTLDIVDETGCFAGGIIAPGLSTSAQRLADAAAKIPVIDLKAPKSVIGKSTQEAVQSGVVLGEVARIDGLVSYIWRELGYKTKVVAAGADAKLLQVLSETVSETVDNLTLHGLKVLYDRNAKGR